MSLRNRIAEAKRRFSDPVPTRWIDPEVYLAFRELRPERKAILNFVKRFGPLGVERGFRAAGSTKMGEAESDWRTEIKEFQECFSAWETLTSGKDAELTRILKLKSWLKHDSIIRNNGERARGGLQRSAAG